MQWVAPLTVRIVALLQVTQLRLRSRRCRADSGTWFEQWLG
jgi:hypothetical protein